MLRQVGNWDHTEVMELIVGRRGDHSVYRIKPSGAYHNLLLFQAPCRPSRRPPAVSSPRPCAGPCRWMCSYVFIYSSNEKQSEFRISNLPLCVFKPPFCALCNRLKGTALRRRRAWLRPRNNRNFWRRRWASFQWGTDCPTGWWWKWWYNILDSVPDNFATEFQHVRHVRWNNLFFKCFKNVQFISNATATHQLKFTQLGYCLIVAIILNF